MKRLSGIFLASLVGAGFGAAWLGCSDEPPPLVPIDSGVDALIDGAIGDSGLDVDPDAPFDAGPAVCSEPMAFGANVAVPNVSTPQLDRFGAISADELTIAWMSAPGTVLYADRAAATDAFGPTKTYSANFVLDRVALSGDGLTLIGVLAGRATFAEVKRGSRSIGFAGPVDSVPYKFLNQQNGGNENDAAVVDAGGVVSDPVLSADGTLFYFTLVSSGTPTLAESLRLGGLTYPSPRLLKEPELMPTNGKLRRPTGISTDGRTLFFWDESTNTERAAFRESVTFSGKTGYTKFLTLGAYPGAQPTKTCGRIYFEGNGSGGVDLFFADRN